MVVVEEGTVFEVCDVVAGDALGVVVEYICETPHWQAGTQSNDD